MSRILFQDKPCAAEGQISYRAAGPYGWIMIGAKDDQDALREGQRSTDKQLTLADLQVWDSTRRRYVQVIGQ
jgi:hypothetical protein